MKLFFNFKFISNRDLFVSTTRRWRWNLYKFCIEHNHIRKILTLVFFRFIHFKIAIKNS